MIYKIQDIQGIGPAFADRLFLMDILSTGDLLAMCFSPVGRKNVAETTGMSPGLILKWSNMADLMRIPGIGPRYAELLEGAGVDTIKELRNRNAANLVEKMLAVNEAKQLCGAVPPKKTIQGWIDSAQNTIPIISF